MRPPDVVGKRNSLHGCSRGNDRPEGRLSKFRDLKGVKPTGDCGIEIGHVRVGDQTRQAEREAQHLQAGKSPCPENRSKGHENSLVEKICPTPPLTRTFHPSRCEIFALSGRLCRG